MLSKVKGKISKDDGNAVIVLGIILIIAALLVGGMLLDISKAYQLKASYTESARKATQSGISQQNAGGYLKAEAAAEAVRVYETIARPASIKEGYMSSCSSNRNVLITITFMKEGFIPGSHVITINSNQVQDISDPNLSRQNIINKMRVNGQQMTASHRRAIENSQYTGIEMVLEESTPNVILPGATTLSGLDVDDLNCQKIGIKAGASQFIGDIDGNYN